MQLKIKAAFLAALSICALSGVASASAFAHEFTASKAGTTTGSSGEQVFSDSAGLLECASSTSTGKVKAGAQKALVETVTYSKCQAFGEHFTASPAEFEYSAEGSVKLLKAMTWEFATGKCHLTITTAGNEKLETAKYSNFGSGIDMSLRIKGIHYESSGGTCGAPGPYTNMTLTAEASLGLEGGTLQFK
jgi:hypothetical protein